MKSQCKLKSSHVKRPSKNSLREYCDAINVNILTPDY